MAEERVKVPLPAGFDIGNQDDQTKLLTMIEQAKGPGWVITGFDPVPRIALLARTVGANIGILDGRPLKAMPLTDKQRQTSQASRVATLLANNNPGWTMIRFEPWIEPSGRVVLAQLSDKELRARQVVANAIGAPEWEVLAFAIPDSEGGGFTLGLPDRYQSAVHEKKLLTAIRQDIGGPGWYLRVDPATLTGRIIPGDPPTFPEYLPFDPTLSTLGVTVFGGQLPKPGSSIMEPALMDWKASNFLLVVGQGGAGKSVLVNNLIAQMIAQHVKISIVDRSVKATDYYWCRPWVEPGGWGCEGLISYAGVLNGIVKEMLEGERAQAWRDNGWQNWWDIPQWAKDKYPLHVIIVDELSSMVSGAAMTRFLPKQALPPVWKTMLESHAKWEINEAILNIVRVGRAQGYRLVLATQKATKETGVPTTLRDLFGGYILLGDKPTPAMISNVFGDADVPGVPENVITEGVSQGCGSALIEGRGAAVFKTFWAGRDGLTDTQALGRWLMDTVGLPDGIDADKYVESLKPVKEDTVVDVEFSNLLTGRIALPEKTAYATSDILPLLYQKWQESLMDDGDDDEGDDDGARQARPARGRGGRASGGGDDDGGPRLLGAARAAHESAMLAAEAARMDAKPAPLCPDCGEPIRGDGSCGCG